jgi:signal transduction histidine kinase
MTLDQVGALSNIVGLAIPLMFSVFIARGYQRPYFMSWTLSYLCYLVTVLLLPVAMSLGPPLWLAAIVLTIYHLGTGSLLKAGSLIEERPTMTTPLRALWVGVWALSVLGLALGMPFLTAVALPLLMMVAAHLLVGWQLFHLPPRPHRHAHRQLAVMIALTGVWGLAFVFLGTGPWAWLGFVISGALHLFVGILMVIFLLEDFASQLKVQNVELQQLDRLKSEFVSTVSHELRTPLSSIKSAIWLLENHRATVNEGELIGIITSQIDILHRLVNDVLDFAKMEAGTMTYQRQQIELGAMTRAVVHDATPRFAQKGVSLVLQPAPGRMQVEADPDRLAQVIGNLLSNALKFTEPDGRVTVSLGLQGGLARLTVTDTGIGIPSDQHKRIFERFYQVDNSSTRRVGGAGLGLAISRAIVEEGHQGQIWVEHAPGGGSTFIVALPLAEEVEPAQRLEPRVLRE